MLPEIFVLLGAAFILIAAGIYLVGTIKGKVKPNRISYAIWGLAPLIAFAAQVSEGVGLQSILTFAIGIGPVLIVAASFLHRSDAWRLTMLDYVCGALSLVGLILWYITQDGLLAILFSLIADIFASIPTIVKSYKAPSTESPIAYFLTGIGAFIIVLTITTWNFATYAFPLYVVLLNVIIYSILKFKSSKRFAR